MATLALARDLSGDGFYIFATPPLATVAVLYLVGTAPPSLRVASSEFPKRVYQSGWFTIEQDSLVPDATIQYASRQFMALFTKNLYQLNVTAPVTRIVWHFEVGQTWSIKIWKP